MKYKEIEISTRGEYDFVNITGIIHEIIKDFKVKDGICNIYLKSTTSAIIVNEDDENIFEDFKDLMKKLVPENVKYRHDLTWGDGNGRSHLRSMLLKNHLTIPVIDGRLALGTWQSIFLVELDIRPRKRQIIVSVIEQ